MTDGGVSGWVETQRGWVHTYVRIRRVELSAETGDNGGHGGQRGQRGQVRAGQVIKLAPERAIARCRI
jgi:hypothetical protein